MKLKYEFSMTDTGDRKIAVAVGDGSENIRGFLKMNHTAASIFEKMRNEISLPDLIALMREEYPEETPENVAQVVCGFLEKLTAAGFVE